MPLAVERAVVTAAGRGSRMWPATRSIQKELLNVVDRPALDYVLGEVAASGIPEALVVVGDRSDDVIRYLEHAEHPRPAGCGLRVSVSAPVPPSGLGRSVLEAREVASDAPFALLLGDNIMTSRVPVLSRLIEVHQATGSSVVALTKVRPEQSHLYGCAVIGEELPDNVVVVRGFVEKPSPDEAPSDVGIIGRYVLMPAIFGVLERLPRGRNNEYQLTDALNILAQTGVLHGVVFDGVRFDIGSKAGLIEAIIGLALERPDLRDSVVEIIRSALATAGQGSETVAG